MSRRPSSASRLALLAIAGTGVVAIAGGCGEQCYIFPTRVELELDRVTVEAPGEVVATAVTTLGSTNCGPNPTEVVAYHWRLDGEPLLDDGGEPLGAEIVVAFDAPGVHVLEVRVEDDLGKELPYVGRSSVLVY